MSHFANEANFLLFLLNDPPSDTVVVTQEAKDHFRSALKTIHSHGYYLAYSFRNKCFTITDRHPDRLKKQINELDKLIDVIISKIS